MKVSKSKWTIVIAALAVSWIIFFPIWYGLMAEMPLDESISLNPPGKIEKQIWIVNPENYKLQFQFTLSMPLDQVARLIGGCTAYQVCYEGIKIPIHWSMTEVKTGHVVLDQTSNSTDSRGGVSFGTMYRHIGDVHLPTGRYIFKAEILSAPSEFKQISPHIMMFVPGKEETTWQTSFCWWGMLIITPLACIAAMWSCLTLIFRFLQFRAKN